MKTFQEITESGELTAAFGVKTTLLNAGSTAVAVLDTDTETQLSTLSIHGERAVLGMYSLQPGESKSLPTGSYSLRFLTKVGSRVVVMIETKDKPVNNKSNAQEPSPAQ